jgi:D-alanyl-D-alanine carboxypeptidase
MPPASPRNAPLRGNGRRYECFLRPLGGGIRDPVALAVHRKSDGAFVASGIVRHVGRTRRIRFERAAGGRVPAAMLRELSGLLARRFPRQRPVFSLDARVPFRSGGRASSALPRRRLRLVRDVPDPARRALAAVCADVPADYGATRGLAAQREPRWLAFAGLDHAGRECWLAPETLRAWRRLDAAAREDGIALIPVSGFRSADYQARILAAKRARGLAMAEILAVNAAPGYSEHHTGRALDLTTPGCPPAEAEFEHTAAWRWLAARAVGFGFRMSYPRGNPHGLVPEPWHWFHVRAPAPRP